MAMTVKTYVTYSKVDRGGLGLFANQFIPKGTLMWEIHPTLDTFILNGEFDTLPEMDKEFIRTYAIKEVGGWQICGDNARYINHSRNPNMIPYNGKDYASRDISIEEEITYDYRNFTNDHVILQEWI